MSEGVRWREENIGNHQFFFGGTQAAPVTTHSCQRLAKVLDGLGLAGTSGAQGVATTAGEHGSTESHVATIRQRSDHQTSVVALQGESREASGSATTSNPPASRQQR